MTVVEFEEHRAGLQCLRCRHVGLESYRPANGNHVGAQCPECGSKAPLGGAVWFAQGGSSDRVRRMKSGDVREVWSAAGDHCAFCGKDWELCEALRIGRTVQHVHPVMFGGAEDGVKIPFCARCQEMSRAALLTTRDMLAAQPETIPQMILRLRKKYGVEP